MAGTDYTTTANLGLYLPVYDADDGMWGTHLNSNATTLDGAVHALQTAGPFLPLSGGTMQGAVALAGVSTAPTAVAGTNTTQIATTAFVETAVGSIASAGVSTFNGRSGAVTLSTADVTGAGGAPLASPTFTGTPAAPTPTGGDNSTKIATTAFVAGAVSAGAAGVASFNTRTGAVTLSNADVTTVLPGSATTPAMNGTAAVGTGTTWARADHVHPSDTTRAPLASPVFTGDPQAPTAAAGDNDTSVATTAFVHAAVAPAFNDTGRNKIHNPLFSIAQRGPGPFTASGIYALDRWCTYIATDTASFLQYAATDTDRSQIGDEAANLFLTNTFTGNAAAAACNIIFQRIEGVRRLANKTVTVSFYAQASTTQKLGVSVDQNMGTGGTPSADVLGNGQAVQLSAGWARYSLPFVLPSLAGKTLGTAGNDYTTLNFWYSCGATSAIRAGNIGVQTGIINLWGVQVEIGSVATPLEKPDPQQDLAKCQRFYQVGFVYIDTYAAAVSAICGQSQPFPVQMRSAPTIVPNWTSLTNCSANFTNATQYSFLPYLSSTAAGQCYLTGSFTASADL